MEMIKIDSVQFGITSEQAESVKARFLSVIEKMKDVYEEYGKIQILDPSDSKNSKIFGDVRKKFVKIRTETASIHKEEKALYLKFGKYIDSWKNEQELYSKKFEDDLAEKEKYFEIQEQKRIKLLTDERIEKLKTYDVFVNTTDIEKMSDEIFEFYILGIKNKYEEKIRLEKEEAERVKQEQEQQEKARLEKEEAERIERERIKAEQVEQQRIIDIEKEKVRIEQEKFAEQKREQQRLFEIEQEKQRQEQNRLLQEQKRIEQAKKEQEELERAKQEKIKADIEKARIEKERIEQGGDKEKIKDYLNKLKSVSLPQIENSKINTSFKTFLSVLKTAVQNLENEL